MWLPVDTDHLLSQEHRDADDKDDEDDGVGR